MRYLQYLEQINKLLILHRRRLLKYAAICVPLSVSLLILVLMLRDLPLNSKPLFDVKSLTSYSTETQTQVIDTTNRRIVPIFGQYEADVQAKKISSVDIPTTSLNLTLHAIFYSTKIKAGMALVSKQGSKNSTLYSVGESIMRGVKLQQVLVNKVIINRNGQSESLRLPRLGKDT